MNGKKTSIFFNERRVNHPCRRNASHTVTYGMCQRHAGTMVPIECSIWQKVTLSYWCCLPLSVIIYQLCPLLHLLLPFRAHAFLAHRHFIRHVQGLAPTYRQIPLNKYFVWHLLCAHSGFAVAPTRERESKHIKSTHTWLSHDWIYSRVECTQTWPSPGCNVNHKVVNCTNSTENCIKSMILLLFYQRKFSHSTGRCLYR